MKIKRKLFKKGSQHPDLDPAQFSAMSIGFRIKQFSASQ
jgi:hypothetical protein